MGLIWYAAAALWGVAEATFFFIVPDVLLTFATVRFGARAGVRLSLVAAAAAALAGITMWGWGHHDIASARAAMLMVPAVGADLVERAAAEMKHWWALHLVVGAVTGLPYKLYAVAAGARGINLLLFVPASFVARLTRFLFSVGLTALPMAVLSRLDRKQWTWRLVTAAWIILYAGYFTWRTIMAG